jgi:hypothetical protein
MRQLSRSFKGFGFLSRHLSLKKNELSIMISNLALLPQYSPPMSISFPLLVSKKPKKPKIKLNKIKN